MKIFIENKITVFDLVKLIKQFHKDTRKKNIFIWIEEHI